jgi:hypothetical protein
MKRFKSLKVSISMLVVVLLVSTLFISCGGGSMSCSLDAISPSTDDIGEAVFMAKGNDSSDEKTEQTQAIVSALNNAIKDRIDLAEMLEAESSSDSFLETLQSFADTNYRKAVKMFPDMTCEEFYYCSAVGYAVAYNKNNDFQFGYDPLSGDDKFQVYTPTPDQIMSCAFWTSYSSQRYGIDYQDEDDRDVLTQDRFECENLDSDASFELRIIVQMATKESLVKGDIEIGHRSGWDDSIVVLSLHMTNKIRDILKSSGVKRVSLDDDDYFSQIGNVSAYFGLIMKHFADGEDLEVKLGHMGAVSGVHLNALDSGDTVRGWNTASRIVADLCHANIKGSVAGSDYDIMIWADRKIKNWYSPIQP